MAGEHGSCCHNDEDLGAPDAAAHLASQTQGVALGEPSGPPSRHRGLIVNITPVERIGRIAIGLATAVIGLVLLASAGSPLAVVLEVLLIAAGLDLVVTGALGHCPLYQRLGHISPSLVGRHD